MQIVSVVTFYLGLQELINETRQNYDLKPINSLCSIGASTTQFLCFEQAQPLQSIMGRYHIMSYSFPNEFFKNIWSSVLKNESKAQLTFSDIVSRIWEPVFSQCCMLIESVQKRSIKLRDVDRFFHQREGQYIYQHLKSLFSAIEACYGRTADVTGWISNSVHLMEQYWALCLQAEAANIVLELKDSLRLTGDFEIIEDVASKVSESMRDATLDIIDDKLIDATSFLEQVTGDGYKLQCLRTFARCANIVEWIRKETKG